MAVRGEAWTESNQLLQTPEFIARHRLPREAADFAGPLGQFMALRFKNQGMGVGDKELKQCQK